MLLFTRENTDKNEHMNKQTQTYLQYLQTSCLPDTKYPLGTKHQVSLLQPAHIAIYRNFLPISFNFSIHQSDSSPAKKKKK